MLAAIESVEARKGGECAIGRDSEYGSISGRPSIRGRSWECSAVVGGAIEIAVAGFKQPRSRIMSVARVERVEGARLAVGSHFEDDAIELKGGERAMSGCAVEKSIGSLDQGVGLATGGAAVEGIEIYQRAARAHSKYIATSESASGSHAVKVAICRLD